MKKYRLKKKVKIIITIVLVLLGLILYHFLGVLGGYTERNILSTAFILLGWIWLLAGQVMLFYAMWED